MASRFALAVVSVLVAVVACGGSEDDRATTSAVESTVASSAPGTVAGGPSPAFAGSLPPSSTTAPERVHDPEEVAVPDGAVVPVGFERVQATVTTADGLRCELCVWLADNGDRRSQGLRFVDDIGPADGMAFVYPAPDTRTYTMDGVRIDLDIAFFDAERTYMEDFRMEACPLGGCRLYPTPEGITVALEVRPGSLPDLGIAPGSIIEITDLPCG